MLARSEILLKLCNALVEILLGVVEQVLSSSHSGHIQLLVTTDLLDQGSGLVHVENTQLVRHSGQPLHQANGLSNCQLQLGGQLHGLPDVPGLLDGPDPVQLPGKVTAHRHVICVMLLVHGHSVPGHQTCHLTIPSHFQAKPLLLLCLLSPLHPSLQAGGEEHEPLVILQTTTVCILAVVVISVSLVSSVMGRDCREESLAW